MALFQNFLMKQLFKKQLASIPEAEQEKIFAAIEKNPDFFKNIAEEIQKEMGTGKSQMEAAMTVMKSHETELREVLGK